jgi:hypothetical protein
VAAVLLTGILSVCSSPKSPHGHFPNPLHRKYIKQENNSLINSVGYRASSLLQHFVYTTDLNARVFPVQMKEIANKMIICNIHRFLQFLIIEEFYRAKLQSKKNHPDEAC